MEEKTSYIDNNELENLRKKVQSSYKKMFRSPFIVFGILLVGMFFKNSYMIMYMIEGAFTADAFKGGLFILLGDLLIALTISATFFCLFNIFVYQKKYSLFNRIFKNKYILQTLQELECFSELNYQGNESQYSFEELAKMQIVPMGNSNFFDSTDKLNGVLENLRFRSGNVTTAKPNEGRKSTPDTLFTGQIISFSVFDERKISEGRIQILPKKYKKHMGSQLLSHQIQTENILFNQHFLVYAENEHNAFYILTPQVIENILAFFEKAGDTVSLVFDNSELHAAIQQFRNPFNVYIDLPVEEQKKNIIKDSEIIQSARKILVNIPTRGQTEKSNDF